MRSRLPVALLLLLSAFLLGPAPATATPGTLGFPPATSTVGPLGSPVTVSKVTPGSPVGVSNVAFGSLVGVPSAVPAFPVAVPSTAPGFPVGVFPVASGTEPLAALGDLAPHVDRDTVPPRLSSGWGVAVPLLLSAVLPSIGWAAPLVRAVADVAEFSPAGPRPAAGPAPARAPPSTTR